MNAQKKILIADDETINLDFFEVMLSKLGFVVEKCDDGAEVVEKVRKFLQNFQLVRSKLKVIEEKDRIRNFQPPIDGLQIMELFNLPPGQAVGELKSAIKDAILDGIISNEYEAAYNYLLMIALEKGLQVAGDPASSAG